MALTSMLLRDDSSPLYYDGTERSLADHLRSVVTSL